MFQNKGMHIYAAAYCYMYVNPNLIYKETHKVIDVHTSTFRISSIPQCIYAPIIYA